MPPLSYGTATTPVCRAATARRRSARRPSPVVSRGWRRRLTPAVVHGCPPQPGDPRPEIEHLSVEQAYSGAMTVALQGSLLDAVDEVGLRMLGPAVRRTVLSRGAWLDVRPGWLTGSDALFARLSADVPWYAERRQMYDREVDVPRLLSFYGEEAALPHPVLEEARVALSRHYADELGEPFRTAGLCLYRDGRDSVAWHGDRIGRSRTEDTMVAILSVGAARPLL